VNVRADLGITVLFAAAGTAVLTLLHYVFLRKYTNIDTMFTFAEGLLQTHLSGERK
jgi:hypothetical protein